MRVVFVCTANVCRSPLAEHLLRRLLVARGIDEIEVTSAGLHAQAGAPATEAARRVAAAHGLDLGAHRARPVAPGWLGSDDLVLVMEELQRRQLLASGEVSERSVRLLGRFAAGEGDEVEDPIGGPDVAYERCIERLERCLDGLLAWLEDERIARS